MNQSNANAAPSSKEHGSGAKSQTELYERLLSEKDNQINQLTAALDHERGKQRSGIWPDLRAGFIGYALGLPLGIVKILVVQAFITHTASMMVFSFLAIYFSLVTALVFFLGRKVYRNWKAARGVSPEASYGVQLFYSGMLSCAITMEIITSPYGNYKTLVEVKWVLLASLIAAVYNYCQMRVHTKRVGKPLPRLPQIGAWLNLKA